MVEARDVRFGFKVVQIGPKWDKSGTFSDHISVHFVSASKNVMEFDLKNSRICPVWSQSEPLWAQIWLHLLREPALALISPSGC